MAKRNKLLKKEKRQHLKNQHQPKRSQEQEEKPKKPKNKIWKRIGLFDNYEDAAKHKTKILSSAKGPSVLEVKIKRCGSEGNQFQVKLWAPSLKGKK